MMSSDSISETSSGLKGNDPENQSCSGQILTKLQCIRMSNSDAQLVVEQDTEGREDSFASAKKSSRDVFNEMESNTIVNQTSEVSTSDIERSSQSCSGTLLTTLQCIKMPVPDSETNSVGSVESAYIQSQNSLHETNTARESGESVSVKSTEVSNIGDVSSINMLNTTDLEIEQSHFVSNRSTKADDAKSKIKEATGILSVASSTSDVSQISHQSVEHINSREENSAQDQGLNYVRRLLENDPNVDRAHLFDILVRLAANDDEIGIQEFGASLEAPVSVAQLYSMGQLVYVDCDVCFEKKDLNLRSCCDKPVCDDCMLSFIVIQVQQAIVKIQCPAVSCDKFVERDEIMTRLTGEMKDKFYKYLVDANKDPYIKTCPRCSTVMNIEPNLLRNPKIKKRGLCVTCNGCQLEWCFTCQAPWHTDIKCKQFREGDKLFRRWTKEQHFGQPNARKCPKCKVFIQRSAGCDHMRCVKCNTDFCYQCGEKFMHFKFIGDHYSRFSIFGCKYRLYPNNPARRKFIRGSIFGSKLLLTPIIAGLVVGAGAVILAGGIFILPVWAGFRIRRHLREKEARRRERAYRDHWQRRREDIMKRGDPYLEHFNHMHSLGMNPYNLGLSAKDGSSQGDGKVLMVDELDMRIPHLQLDSLSLTSLDNNSSADSYCGAPSAGGQRIKLSPNSLDIHAPPFDVDTKPEVIKLEPVYEVNIESSHSARFDRVGFRATSSTDEERSLRSEGQSLTSTSSVTSSFTNGARPKVPKVRTRKAKDKELHVLSDTEKLSGDDASVSRNSAITNINASTSTGTTFSDSISSDKCDVRTRSEKKNEKIKGSSKARKVSSKTSKETTKESEIEEISAHDLLTKKSAMTSSRLPYVDDFVAENAYGEIITENPMLVHRSNSNRQV